MYHFDIPKTRQYDTGKIEVIARSSVGEAVASCELKITPRRDDYRGVLKNSPRRKCIPPQTRPYDTISLHQNKQLSSILATAFAVSIHLSLLLLLPLLCIYSIWYCCHYLSLTHLLFTTDYGHSKDPHWRLVLCFTAVEVTPLHSPYWEGG